MISVSLEDMYFRVLCPISRDGYMEGLNGVLLPSDTKWDGYRATHYLPQATGTRALVCSSSDRRGGYIAETPGGA
jgi:hypothetical protein